MDPSKQSQKEHCCINQNNSSRIQTRPKEGIQSQVSNDQSNKQSSCIILTHSLAILTSHKATGWVKNRWKISDQCPASEFCLLVIQLYIPIKEYMFTECSLFCQQRKTCVSIQTEEFDCIGSEEPLNPFDDYLYMALTSYRIVSIGLPRFTQCVTGNSILPTYELVLSLYCERVV